MRWIQKQVPKQIVGRLKSRLQADFEVHSKADSKTDFEVDSQAVSKTSF